MAWHKRFLNLLRGDRVSRDIEREMEFHLAERADELVASGMSEAEAAREARRRFGNRDLQRDRTRDADVLPWLESLVADLRYAARALRGSPGFALVAVLSLGLGIGANTAIFSLVDAVLLKPLPVRDPQELVQVVVAPDDGSLSNPIWEEIRDRQDVFSGVFAFAGTRFDLARGGEARRVDGAWVSGGFFATLGVRPAAGRLLKAADDVRGCPAVAVVSHGFWQTEYGGAADAVGRTVSLDGHPFQVVGVAPPGFFGVEVGRAAQVYAPLCAEAIVKGSESALDERSHWFINVIGRPRPGLGEAQVRARLATLSPGIFAATLPADWDPEGKQGYLRNTLEVKPAANGLSGIRLQYRDALLALMGVAGAVLLIACANVANLLLARAAVRRREIAIRVAIGAGRGRLVRQLLTESLLLALLGAAVGVLFARWASAFLVGFLSTRNDTVWLDLPLDGRLLAFTLATAVATGVLFGLAPAWRSTRVAPHAAIKGDEQQGRRRRATLPLGKALVVGQVALSLVLVVAAGLLLGTFRTLATMDPGFRRGGVLLVTMDLGKAEVPEERRREVQMEVLERLRAVPGVRAASASDFTPVSGAAWNGDVIVDGFVPATRDDGIAYFNAVSDGFFAAMGTDLLAGRDIAPGDGAGSAQVAVINRTLARRFFGDENPVGRQFRIRAGPEEQGPIEVVGVVEDAKYRSLREETLPVAYLPMRQQQPFGTASSFELRADGPPAALAAGVARAMAEVDPRISLRFTTLSGQLAASLRLERLMATLSGFFGGIALLLAAIGLYGTMSYSVARRRTEIGIRMALGAARERVVGMVLGEVGRMLAVGVVCGLAVALAATRLMESFLFGLAPSDPGTIALAALVLTVTVLAAGAWPAWRAARVDPRVALQEE